MSLSYSNEKVDKKEGLIYGDDVTIQKNVFSELKTELVKEKKKNELLKYFWLLFCVVTIALMIVYLFVD